MARQDGELVSERDGRRAEFPVSSLFLERWSPRAFTGEPIPRATLMSIFEAARWAPSGFNAQPWRFVYALRDTPAWAPFLGALIPYNQAWAQGAAALAFVLSKAKFVSAGRSEPRLSTSASFDAGAAWACLALQAETLGWPAHGMTGFDAEAARRAIKADEEYRIEAAIAIGRRLRREEDRPNGRRPLSETVFEAELG